MYTVVVLWPLTYNLTNSGKARYTGVEEDYEAYVEE